MKINLFEDSESSYTLDEIVSQIEEEFGFECIVDSSKLTIVLDNLAKITLELDLDDTGDKVRLTSYRMKFKNDSINLTYTSILLDTYSAAIESTRQVNELLKRMGLYLH